MIVEFCKWGNSLAVRIPRALADAINASDGKRAEISVENGALVLRPLVKRTRKSRYMLDEFLHGMTWDRSHKKWIGVRGAAMRHGDVVAHCPDAG